MGLLDEAIREHLELRRRSGADPAELAREEQEALQPIDAGELPAWAMSPASLEPAQRDTAQPDPPDIYDDSRVDAAGPPAAAAAVEPVRTVEFGARELEQETVEIDMAAVLAQEDAAAGDDVRGEASLGGAFRARRITGTEAGFAEEDLEWEVPEARRA